MKQNIQMTLRSGLSVFAGLIVGILFSYLVYRLSLPVKPFVYVAF
jgi:xanthosine utilization system XapX-like protein